ncbi:NHL repeat-containing protein [Flavilitoribacter nigricans]|uniref:Uncharacterized protein n=1 Tax=Flavilitoribacter nigricans (strain ATCC 23147 / DSM 23189 / NBRC 102662 / NCIMB 1420 / SS-2) TaxID=1122177 RepID=A0A2D0NFU2_FLAN2|nr:hypothetical protein [Flavilitoribacter nigricans]PHN07361.1 hypothetical protein CRP01_06950 [Flavilitoribacter nigricans DSM 23189 = NBRC 102662]
MHFIHARTGKTHYLLTIALLLIVSTSCQKENDAQKMDLEPVRDISMRDNDNQGNASDIEVNFTKQFNTSPIELYRIYLLKSNQLATHDLSFLESLSEAHYVEVAPDDIFPVQGKLLKQQMLDTDGDQIMEGASYRTAVVSAPKDPGLWRPSLAYSEVDLVPAQNNLVKPYSSSLETGAGNLAISDQGTLAMSPYDIVADLSGSNTETSPVHFFDAAASFTAPNQLFGVMGGSAFDSRGNFYMAHTFAGQILKIDDNGVMKMFEYAGPELSEPDGIFINAKDEIFIADRKTGAVIRILPDGTGDLVAVIEPGVRGLTGDDAGNLFASMNRENGAIIKITPDGQTSKFAQIPTFVPPDYLPPFLSWTGYLTYHRGDLYIAGTSTHRIYKIDAIGTVTVFAGSGTKLLPKGDALTAHFNRPIGLAFSADGKHLFVSGCLDVTPQHVQASRPSRIYEIEIF